MNLVKELAALIKFRVVLLSTLSAVTGFVLAARCIPIELPLFITGIFALAAGSAALNQFQEHRLDRLMERTRHRPIPTGQLAPGQALGISLFLMVIGLAVLAAGFGVVPALLGAVTIIFYNGIYTVLKRVTAFAALPGALVGALPPAIGWAAGGGNATSPVLIGLMAFFFLWQVPHFWLLLGVHAGDYRKAGFPSLTEIFSSDQLGRITFTWVLAAACAGMLFPLFGVFNHALSPVFLAVAAVWLGLHAVPLTRLNRIGKKSAAQPLEPVFRRTFRDINIFALLIMVILIIDHGVL